MAAHLFPISSCASKRTRTSSKDHASRRMLGSSTFIHRSRHCFVVLPAVLATSRQSTAALPFRKG